MASAVFFDGAACTHFQIHRLVRFTLRANSLSFVQVFNMINYRKVIFCVSRNVCGSIEKCHSVCLNVSMDFSNDALRVCTLWISTHAQECAPMVRCPREVAALCQERVLQVACGDFHTAVIAMRNGARTLYAWGMAGAGALGNGFGADVGGAPIASDLAAAARVEPVCFPMSSRTSKSILFSIRLPIVSC